MDLGEKGNAARRLEYFVTNVMDQKWRYEPGDQMGADSLATTVKLKVIWVEKGGHQQTATKTEWGSRPIEKTETTGCQPKQNHKHEATGPRILMPDPAKKP